MFQRRNNIRFFNVVEEHNEELDKKLCGICNKYLPSSCALNNRSFERIYRMGSNLKSKNRIDGKQYSNMEQYLFTTLAALFGDNGTKKLTKQENDPVKIKSFGKKIQYFDMVLWNSKVIPLGDKAEMISLDHTSLSKIVLNLSLLLQVF